ncbi:MAG: ribose-phosphate diphosphokinase [Candidatus Aminicenantia bacterium]
MKIFSGSSNHLLAEEIGRYLNKSLGESVLKTFSDGEIQFQIVENVRGADVFVIQSTSYEVNFHLMELLIMVDAFKRASADRITAVIPYYGYARQDRKDKPRVPITARLVADLLEKAGVSRVLTMDLHAHQIQGFFSIPVDNLLAAPVLCDYIEKLNLNNVVVVSPDAGGVERARMFAKRLNSPLAIVDKRRTAPNVAELMNIIGEVEGKEVIVVDDIVDTAGTLSQTGEALKERGASRIFAACTHPVLSGKAIEKIEASPFEELIITNTIQIPEEKKRCKKLAVLSVAKLFGEAIRRIHESSSVSSLFT